MTGHPAMYHVESIEELNATLSRGETAFVDPRFRDRSLGERVLADLLPRCWKLNPDDRIDITEMVAILEAAVTADGESSRTATDDESD